MGFRPRTRVCATRTLPPAGDEAYAKSGYRADREKAVARVPSRPSSSSFAPRTLSGVRVPGQKGPPPGRDPREGLLRNTLFSNPVCPTVGRGWSRAIARHRANDRVCSHCPRWTSRASCPVSAYAIIHLPPAKTSGTHADPVQTKINNGLPPPHTRVRDANPSAGGRRGVREIRLSRRP